MDLSYGTRYDDLRVEIRTYLAKQGAAVPSTEIGAVVDHKQHLAWQKKLVDQGYVGRTIPKGYGGFGVELDLLEGVVIEEEFARAQASLGMQNQGIGMLVPTLLEYGNEDQKQAFIGRTLRGELIWCQGYSEPGSGSDLASLSTRGELRGDRYIVNGQKIWTSTANRAAMMFALVRTEPEAGKHAGISYLLVDMKTPGIEVRPLMTMTGDSSFNEVFFTDVEVPRKNVVGEPGQGWAVGTSTLRHERGLLGRSHQTESFLASCLEVLCKTGLLADPVYRDRLMRIQARVLAMKYNGMRTLTDHLSGRSPGLAGLITKLNGCQLNYEVCGLAIDALQERGLILPETSEASTGQGAWQRHFMYSLGLIIGGGTAQIQKNIISEAGLGMPREPKVAPQ